MDRLIFIFFFLFVSQVSLGSTTQEELVKKYTIEKLDSAANILRVAVDQAVAGKEGQENVCGIKKEEALSYINELKPLLDAKFAYIRSMKTKVKIPVPWLRCQTNCHCGVYERYGETLNLDLLSLEDQGRLKKIQVLASQADPKSIKRCVSVSRWFCESPLLRYLKKQKP